jgi:hypothetical protein
VGRPREGSGLHGHPRIHANPDSDTAAAARLIDGEQVVNVVQFSVTSTNVTTNGTVSSEAV